MARVAHITDLHLSVQNRVVHEVDLWDQFERVLSALEHNGVEFLIVGGDLALHTGDEATYAAIAKRLGRLPFDYVLQPGNHDDRELFAAAFGRRYRGKGGPLDLAVEWNGTRLLLIDSSSGTVGSNQLSWVESQWIEIGAAALFIHHPVFQGISVYMEKRYELENAGVVKKRLTALPGAKHLFSGHYHTPFQKCDRDLCQYVTPAVFYQLDAESDEFAVSSRAPGYRLIDFGADGTIERTWVEYANQ